LPVVAVDLAGMVVVAVAVQPALLAQAAVAVLHIRPMLAPYINLGLMALVAVVAVVAQVTHPEPEGAVVDLLEAVAV
jgi:hypothetical protein